MPAGFNAEAAETLDELRGLCVEREASRPTCQTDQGRSVPNGKSGSGSGIGAGAGEGARRAAGFLARARAAFRFGFRAVFFREATRFRDGDFLVLAFAFFLRFFAMGAPCAW